MGYVGRLNRTGMEACKGGQYEEAENSLLAALSLAQSAGGGCNTIKIHSNLGIVYELQGRLEKARHHYLEAMKLMMAKKAVNHPLHTRLFQSMERVSLPEAASQ